MSYFKTFSVHQNIQLQNVGRMVTVYFQKNSERTNRAIVSCCTSIRIVGPAITLQICKNIQPYFRNSKDAPTEYNSGS